MNFVQQLEECLRDLAAEARKKHPGVKEASERATLKLRSLKTSYVSAVRQASSGHGQNKHPTTRLFQSSDLLHPFLLAANYPTATNNLLEISFRAVRLLMEADAVVPADGLNLVRVWMIQAHVVAAYYQRQYHNKTFAMSSRHGPEEATSAATSSSSWFSWGASSSTTTSAGAASIDAVSTAASMTATTTKLSVKNAVSSSSGQTGQNAQSPVAMERLALEILSCLLQLLELLKAYPDSLTPELWTNAVALACLWLYQLPPRHKVQQAAQATTVQVLMLLFQQQQQQQPQTKNARAQKFRADTWQDLWALASSSTATTTSSPPLQFAGAFALCKTTTTAPQPAFALELVTQIWKDGYFQAADDERQFLQTLSVTKGLWQQQQRQLLSVEMTLRTIQWSLVLLQTRSAEYPAECREIFAYMIQPIAAATDACRSHHDFEDGFVYDAKEGEAQAQPEDDDGSDVRRAPQRNEALSSFLPPPVLWKAGFAVEAVHVILDYNSKNSSSPERLLLLNDKKLVASLTESLSHFATIGASCRDHILQMVDFCDYQMTTANLKPAVIHKAELAVLSGTAGVVFGESDSKAELRKTPSSLANSNSSSSTVLGEALWIAFQSVLQIADSLHDLDDPTTLLEETFAPFLAILQHYLKRVVGSKDMVELSLKGYSQLASVCLPLPDCSMQRKALLTSLAKLSLPSWGKHDPSCQLQEHHVRTLICLLKIVHSFYESISSEWDLILWTFEELSVLHIASPLLSDEAYHSALAVSAVYGRLGAFSTCFSDESFQKMTEALTDICEASMKDRDIVGDSETVLPGKTAVFVESSDKRPEGKETIGGKIMSIGVKAIYGSSDHGDSEKSTSLPLVYRTKDIFYEDYRKSFVDRVAASKQNVRIASIGRLPFSLTLLADLAMTNTFRSQECGEAMSSQLSRLAASTAAVRPFVMDIMTLLIMSQLSKTEQGLLGTAGPSRVVFPDPMLSQLLASEPIAVEETHQTREISHKDILAPLCETIRSTGRADVAESALGVMSMVLQGSGHKLRGSAWSMIIESVASLSGNPTYRVDRSKPEWSSCCLMAFQCLKLIVDDFLTELPPAQGTEKGYLLKCCSAFVSSRHDINTSLTAIGLLWTIADQDSGVESIDLAFSKLVELSSDTRAEVRNAVINTLFSFVVGRGGGFSALRWKTCFTKTIFGLYDSVEAHANAKEPEQKPTSGKLDRYKVGVHHSRDSASKQWVATQALVLRGIIRVLRSFFREILVSADVVIEDPDVPWFQDAWVRILDFAFEAANQFGGRDSLDIRTVGVELLGICCQLTSKAGIHAAATPARVGTNMEVVNGALRSVRESQTSKTPMAHSHSMETVVLRERLFVESFESLECFRDAVAETQSSNTGFPDDTDLQILHKFALALSSVWECCKDCELLPRTIQETSGVNSSSNTKMSSEDEKLEARFVSVVASVLFASTNRDNARFLNQAQRGALELLKTMARNGSYRAFDQLISYGGGAFFVRKDQEGVDESESAEFTTESALNLLNHEAVAIVSEEISKDGLPDDCVLFILRRTLDLFSEEFPRDSSKWRRRHLKRFIPIIVRGLKIISKYDHGDQVEMIQALWESFTSFLSHALSPVPLGKAHMTKIPRVTELLEIIEVAVTCVPKKSEILLCKPLSEGISASFYAAKQHAGFASSHENSEVGRKSKKHRDELMKLFRSCFATCCRLGPEDRWLRDIAHIVLSGVLSEKKSDPERAVVFEASLIVCQIVQETEGMQTLVICLFPILNQLVLSEEQELKQAACNVLSATNISGILDEARVRYEAAERRADEAENNAKALAATVADLQLQNEKLRREVAVLEASSAL